jgi:hypothetical protein
VVSRKTWPSGRIPKIFRPGVIGETPAFVTFLKKDSGLLQIQVPELTGGCLLVFSTPLRAADYARVQTSTKAFECFGSSPAQGVMVIQHFREFAGISYLSLDRCPRCDVFATLKAAALDSADKVIRAWKISKASEIARCNLYWNYARAAAREGKLVLARAVALEIVGHVTAEDPRTHLLLGKLAIRLHDQRLLREAHSFIELLKDTAAREELRTAEKERDWQF